MRVGVVADGFGPAFSAEDASAAITRGWLLASPDDELVSFDPAAGPAGLAQAELAVVGVATFDWSVLRDSLVTAVGDAAARRGVPCVVLAGAVSVGRREAAAVGVDAAYAVDQPGGPTAEALAALAERVARRWSRRPPIGGA